MILIPFLLFISLTVVPLGVPIWVSLGILSSLAFFMATNQHPYVFRLLILGGLLIDIVSLQTWGMTSILLLVFIAMGWGLLFQFETTSSAIVVVLTLCLYIARQIWIGQPVSWFGIIGISLVTWIIYLILSSLGGTKSIKVRQL